MDSSKSYGDRPPPAAPAAGRPSAEPPAAGARVLPLRPPARPAAPPVPPDDDPGPQAA